MTATVQRILHSAGRSRLTRIVLLSLVFLTSMTVHLHAQTPAISFLSPSSGALGSDSVSIIVVGTSFTGSSVARWNGQNRATTPLSPNLLLVTLQAGDLAALGNGMMTVADNTVSSGVPFTVYRGIAATTKDLAYDPGSGRILASVPG